MTLATTQAQAIAAEVLAEGVRRGSAPLCCIGMGLGGRELQRRAEAMPMFFNGLQAAFPKEMLPVPSGVLIRLDGELLGAVGVTGDTSDNDEICALAGIAAAGLEADSKA